MESDNPRVNALLDKLTYLQKAQYSSIESIAEGGMGSILRVFDDRLQRHVALKLVKVGNDDEAEENIARFIQEARITAQLEHPNIMPVHELGMDDFGNLYFAMKEIKGESLEDFLRTVVKFPQMQPPLSHLLNIFLKILDALSFAHSKNVIHRDLKPGNIMLGAHGEVLVLDWGIAVTKDALTASDNVSLEDRNAAIADQVTDGHVPFQTMAGCVLGTPEYMPPEQALGLRDEIDECSDIFAIGIMMYQTFTTHLPFVAQDPLDVLDKVVKENPLSPMALLDKKKQELKDGKVKVRYRNRAIPAALNDIIMKCIEKKKKDRYKNAKLLKKDILDFLDASALQQQSKEKTVKVAPTSSLEDVIEEDLEKVIEGAQETTALTVAGETAETQKLFEESNTPRPSQLFPKNRDFDDTKDMVDSIKPTKIEPASAKLEVSERIRPPERSSRKLVFTLVISMFFLLLLAPLLLLLKIWWPLQERIAQQQSSLISSLHLNEKLNYSKTLATLNKIEISEQEVPVLLYTRFRANIGIGKPKSALKDLEQLLAMKKKGSLNNTWIQFQIAEIYRTFLKDSKKAFEYYLKAEKSSPTNFYSKLAGIRIALEKKEFDKAEKLATAQKAKLNQSWELLLLFAQISAESKKTLAEKTYLAKSVALSPTYGEPYYLYAFCLKKSGKLEEALFYFERACELNQNHSYYLLAAGEHLLNMKQKAKADIYFKKAILAASKEENTKIKALVKQYQEKH